MPLTFTELDITAMHPDAIYSSTDRYYANLASRLFVATRDTAFGRLFGQDERSLLALRLTAYLEDIITDVGFWRSFVELHQKLYGKPLPFCDTDDYEPYVPHREDVQFLVWNVSISIDQENACSPHSPLVQEVVDKVFPLLDRDFDRAPENSELKDWADQVSFIEDYVDVRNQFMYFMSGCYLTADDDFYSFLKEQIPVIEELYHQKCYEESPHDPIYYMALCTVIYTHKVGPLALYPKQWLAALLRSNGRCTDADRVEQMRYSPVGMYEVKEYKGTTVTFCNVDEEQFEVEKSSFGENIEETIKCNDLYLGSMVFFDGVWNANGISAWAKGGEMMRELRAERKAYKKHYRDYDYREFVEKHGGRQLFYFASWQQASQFLSAELKCNTQNTGEPGDNVTVFVNPETANVSIISDVAQYIKDVNNPLYDSEAASNLIELMGGTDKSADEMLRYLIAHGMLSEGRFPGENGLRLMQENLDFIARTVRRDDY